MTKFAIASAPSNSVLLRIAPFVFLIFCTYLTIGMPLAAPRSGPMWPFFDIGFGLAGPITGIAASVFGYPSVFAAGALGAAAAILVARRQPAVNALTALAHIPHAMAHGAGWMKH
jgi:hypothetical protein